MRTSETAQDWRAAPDAIQTSADLDMALYGHPKPSTRPLLRVALWVSATIAAFLLFGLVVGLSRHGRERQSRNHGFGSMNAKTLAKAVAEAKRFIATAGKVQSVEDRSWFMPSKETGAAKRASMDLTRALADMRRSG